MIALFTDFGLHGPYTGQMKAVLHQMAPGIPIIDLFADAPVGNPKASAYLLAAYAAWFPVRTVFLCVVDPGVGGTRPSIFLEADGRWYIGPGNGLFELIQRRARETRSWDIDWKPKHLSAAFTGATSSPRWQPCWRAVIPPAGHVTMAEIAGQTGRMTSARSSTSITSAMP
jgi:S-adenosylmethionine hydrolase